MDASEAKEAIHWTEFGIPIRNIWYMLLYAWGEAQFLPTHGIENVEDAPTLDALLAIVLMKLIQQRLRIGLGRNYTPEIQLLRGIRGRIKFTDSLKRNTFEHGQIYCEVEQFSSNVPKNQIVRSILMRLVQVGQFGPDPKLANELRHNLRWTARMMEGVDLIEMKLSFIRRQQMGRNDRDYRLMLAICEFLLQRQMPSDSTGPHHLPALDHEAMVLFRIYERFIANFYRMHLKNWKVTPQRQLSWHSKSLNRYLPSMHPDLLLVDKSNGRIIVLDTKFTADSLVRNQWGNTLFDSGHLYQMYAYLKTQEHLTEEHLQASGILLYPAVNRNQLAEKIELQQQTIRIETVDLTAPWQEIEDYLLQLVKADAKNAHRRASPADKWRL
jgi:5-methylcytosine-specific restriction enzyme subunit McrC